MNAISDNALLVAFSETSREVNLHHIREACAELNLPTPPVGVSAPAAAAPQTPSAQPKPAIVLDPPKVPGPPKPFENGTGITQNGDGPNLWLEKQQPSLLKRWMRFSK